MTSNRQLLQSQSTKCLLQWINIQRINLNKQGHLYSFSQVIEDGSIFQILLKIDPITFDQVNKIQLIQLMTILQKYLNKQFGKRMKWVFKQSLGDFTSLINIQELLKIVCYFSIHSKMKNDFINRILSLSQETQRFLMDHMQSMDIKLQNITEIRQILEHIEILQRQNQYLKEKLYQMTQNNSKLLQMVKDCQLQRKSTRQQAKKLRQEKYQVFELLRINSITQYLQAYNRIKIQNDKSYEMVKLSERHIQNYLEQIKQLQQRVKCDCVVISSLGDEITRLKQLICKKETNWSKDTNIKIKESKYTQNKRSDICFQRQLNIYEDRALQILDSNRQKQIFKIQSLQAKNLLQVMHSKYTKLNNQINILRIQKERLYKKNLYLENIIKQIQQEYKQFQFTYQVVKKQGQINIRQACKKF